MADPCACCGKQHHDVTGGRRGPSPRWLDQLTAKRLEKGQSFADVLVWRAGKIARYQTLRDHGITT
jgi:hypothetical protein